MWFHPLREEFRSSHDFEDNCTEDLRISQVRLTYGESKKATLSVNGCMQSHGYTAAHTSRDFFVSPKTLPNPSYGPAYQVRRQPSQENRDEGYYQSILHPYCGLNRSQRACLAIMWISYGNYLA